MSNENVSLSPFLRGAVCPPPNAHRMVSTFSGRGACRNRAGTWGCLFGGTVRAHEASQSEEGVVGCPCSHENLSKK